PQFPCFPLPVPPTPGASTLSLHDALPISLVLAALIVSYASSLKAWTEQRAEIAALEEELAERQANVVAYEREIERWKDPSYVEADRKSTRLNSSHVKISYAVFCLKKKKYA